MLFSDSGAGSVPQLIRDVTGSQPDTIMDTARSQNPSLPSSFIRLREALGGMAEKSISSIPASVRIAILPGRTAPVYGTVPTGDAKVVKGNI